MKLTKIIFVFLVTYSISFSQINFPYQVVYNLYPTNPSGLRNGLLGFDNPASLTYQKAPDLYFIWSNGNQNYFNLQNYGFFSAFKNFGFYYHHQKVATGGKVNSYRFSSSIGNRELAFGFAYQWSHTNISNLKMDKLVTFSSLIRPSKIFSIGLIGTSNTDFNEYEGVADLAIRPLSSEALTLFGDYVYLKSTNRKDYQWSSGIVIEPFQGLQLIGRYFDSKSFLFGVQLSLGRTSLLQSVIFNKDGKTTNLVQGIRAGSFDRTLIQRIIKREKSHTIDLNGQIKYQKFQLFDNSKTLYELLDKLEKIKNDATITQVEINTSGMSAPRVFLDELRSKLNELKKHGKKVVIFIDNANISLYHFASVADKIVMDPLGLISLEGILMGRNYYKGTLEKIGLGFDEWRFFKYKSAAETFSRDKMSEADREQRQLIVDNLYNTIKTDIEQSRSNLKLPFDSLVNNFVVFDSKSSFEYGLIDSVGRWYDLKDDSKLTEIIKVVRDNRIEEEISNDFSWGEKSKVAIVYVLGACAMDEGIKARTLIKDIEKISKDKSIKAVVFRVDSPGGDALASDVIAEAMKKLKKSKPVVVSQGSVAGSGGYWLSMYADTIVSNKNTITGSIGVIGSWIYNKRLKEDVGVSTDFVKKGEYADLGFGMIIPILNTVIPDRKLTNDERNKIELMIKEMYSRFIQKVAEGRNKSTEEIENVAQGRVWSGIDAINLGLVDVNGGLEDAIDIARTKANLKKDEFTIVEYPKPQLMDLSAIVPLPLSTQIEKNPTFQLLKFNLKYNGKPLTMMPIEFIPEENLIYDFYR